MKKIIKYSFLIICLSFILYGCSKECEHTYEKTIVESTCATDGYTINTCSLCGDSYNSDIVRAKGHNIVVTKEGHPATCTESGLTDETKCTICNELITEQEKISIKGHSYGSWIEVTAPTTTNTGLIKRVCSNDSNHVEECTLPILDKLNSSYVYVLEPSTCTALGSETYKFSKDGQVFEYEFVVEKIPHVYEEKITAPTCTAEGYTTYTCYCSDSYKDNYVDATGHTYQTEVVNPTCTAEGYTTYTCHCGDSYTGDITKKIPHEYEEKVTAPTCTAEGYTTYTCHCGDTYTDNVTKKIPHEYEEKVTAPTCTAEGYTTYTCHCGDTYTDNVTKKIPHEYEEKVTAPTCTAEGYTTYTCHCGDTYTDNVTKKIPHEYEEKVTAPTCTLEGYTTYTCYCGDTYKDNYVDATGHSYGHYTATVIPTTETYGLVVQECLNGCGSKNTKEVPPLSNSNYTITSVKPTCTVDGEDTYTCLIDNQEFNFKVIVPKTGHTYVGKITAPTCTEEGYTTYTCHCNDSYIDNKVPSLGHDEVVSEEAISATCLESGKTEKISCSRCEKVIQEATETSPLGHSDKNYNYECDRCEILCGDDIVYISTYEDFVKINENLGGLYQLTADITIANDSWNGLGNSTNPFTGYLYGDGYTISGLNSTSLIYNNCGIINNVILKGASISCATNEDVTMGLLTTLNSGVIKNCKLKGANRITAACSYVIKDAKKSTNYEQNKTYITGGITAINDGSILNCVVEDSFTTIFNNYTEHDFYIAPIFGGFYSGEMATSSMTVYFGIIAGKNNSVIENCNIYAKNVNTFNVSGKLSSNSGYARTFLTAYVATICGSNTGNINSVKVYQEPTMSQSVATSVPDGSNNFDCGILNSLTIVTNNDFKYLISSNSGQIKEVLLMQ